MKNSKPTWKEILAFAVGDGGCNLVWTTIGSYLTLYYTDSVGLAAAAIGTMMLLTRLLDGISDLIMGSIIDRTMGKSKTVDLMDCNPNGTWTGSDVQCAVRTEQRRKDGLCGRYLYPDGSCYLYRI